MKKRSIICLLLCVSIIFALVLTGCNNNVNPADSTESATEAVTETPAADGIEYMALVNKTHALPDTWEDKLETVHMTNSVGDDVEVEKKAYDAYLKLKEALEAEDIHVDLDSARRSVEAQQRIMDDFTEKYGADYAAKTVAKPGYSEHHTGLALDLYLIIDGKDVVLNEEMIQYPEIWAKIHEKLADYGFILRYLDGEEHITGYGYEPWHIRYIDNVDIAKEITSKGIQSFDLSLLNAIQDTFRCGFLDVFTVFLSYLTTSGSSGSSRALSCCSSGKRARRVSWC